MTIDGVHESEPTPVTVRLNWNSRRRPRITLERPECHSLTTRLCQCFKLLDAHATTPLRNQRYILAKLPTAQGGEGRHAPGSEAETEAKAEAFGDAPQEAEAREALDAVELREQSPGEQGDSPLDVWT